ncbi:MAG: T9SS type A sorting domain-containing protein [Chitinophagales bacterium]|nr:T9SS type A sorting domain-containing protein [Chitinophagales bacterium]
MNFLRTFLAALLFAYNCLPIMLSAQIGTLDTSFYKSRGYDFKCTGGLVLPDSSVIVIGRFFFANNQKIAGIARVFPDGTIDPAFNTGTGADEHVNVVARQPDGKLIIGGDFVMFNGVLKNRIARLNPDGSLDNSFNTGSGFSFSVYDIKVLSTGKILVAGGFTHYNGDLVNGLVRLNPDGTRDTTFLIGSAANNNVYDVDELPDGRIIVAGHFTIFNGDTVGRILRLHPNGTRDTTFKTLNGGADNIITSAYVTVGNKVVIGGFFNNYDGSPSNRIARLNSDGSLDATFNVGTGFNNNVNEICIQPDGKVLATGNFTSYAGSAINRIVRINNDGTRDLSFQPGGGLNLSCNSVFMAHDDRIYVGGTFTIADSFARIRFVRLLPDGKVDQTFNRESHFSAFTNVVDMQSDGRLIVAGAFFKYHDITKARIIRYNHDGTLDLSFPAGSGANDQITAIAIQTDDKIVIGGNFTTIHGVARNRLARLNADGSLDTTFNVGTGFNGAINKIAIDSLGKIYVGGAFTQYNGNNCNRIVRLNPNGSIDNTFNFGTGFNGTVWTIKPVSNLKVLIGGAFTSYNGTTGINRIARINNNGTLDNTFTPGTAANGIIYSIEVADNGYIYTGGSFTSFNGTSKQRIARLMPNGALDNTYTAAVNNSYVGNIVILPIGVLIIGEFTSVNGIPHNQMAFTDFNGNISGAFYIGDGVIGYMNSYLYSRMHQRIFLAGSFLGVQGYLRNYFASLRTSNLDLTDYPLSLCQGANTKIYIHKPIAFAAFNNMIVQLSDSAGNFNNAINIGVKNSALPGNDSISVIIPFSVPSGSGYRLRVISTAPADTSNFSRAIQIGPLGGVTITPSGPTTFCSGNTVTLNAPIADSYQWSNNASTQNITVSTSGSYTVSVTVNGCPASSNTITVTVHPAPDSSLSFSNYDLCNITAVLTAAPGYTYLWSTGSTGQTVAVSATGTYSVTVTGAGGCSADSSIFVNLSFIDSNLISANGPTSFCQGQSVQLSGVPGLSYTWNTGATGQSITVNTTGNYFATVSDGACTKNSNTIQVTVFPPPAANISPVGPDKLCVGGGSVTLQASPAAAYLWNTSHITSSITATTAGNYTVTITDNNGCTASGSYNLSVYAPSVNVSANGSTTFCAGGSVQLTASGGDNYAWSNGANTTSITVSTSGNYNVTSTDPSSGCTVASNAITVTVNPLPNVSLSLPVDTICQNASPINLAGGNPAGGTYSGTGVSGGTFNPAGLTGNIPITYTYTDANNCTASATDAFFVDICLGTLQITAEAMRVYPNPAQGWLTVETTEKTDKIELWDIAGRKVIEFTAEPSFVHILDVSALQSGVYTIKAGLAAARFIK